MWYSIVLFVSLFLATIIVNRNKLGIQGVGEHKLNNL